MPENFSGDLVPILFSNVFGLILRVDSPLAKRHGTRNDSLHPWQYSRSKIRPRIVEKICMTDIVKGTNGRFGETRRNEVWDAVGLVRFAGTQDAYGNVRREAHVGESREYNGVAQDSTPHVFGNENVGVERGMPYKAHPFHGKGARDFLYSGRRHRGNVFENDECEIGGEFVKELTVDASRHDSKEA